MGYLIFVWYFSIESCGVLSNQKHANGRNGPPPLYSLLVGESLDLPDPLMQA